ncbi:hypothetical protein [Nitrosovibrio sp. Nv17]|jgi:hypothetical protein|uniref:hypothetical protein n=1 Tax=Nitrosovibrio sp. Nv17 TaxID=1855339 RepID=UPI0009086D5D|nr:hypothetical protein [Nitrosovibrio sp. Nv17]SFW35238.1 hypothetical protein SAMN05216414_12210 [Nitrosovibrio sp. Nv17]
MKRTLLAAALMALALTACKRPEQALPENSTTYGTRLEGGSTMDEERSAIGQSTTAEDVATADAEDEYSGQAVLPGHQLDGNGNPLPPGQSAIPEGH